MTHRGVRYAFHNNIYTFWFSGHLKAIGFFRLDTVDEVRGLDRCVFIDIFTKEWMTVEIDGDNQYGELTDGTVLRHCTIPDVAF